MGYRPLDQVGDNGLDDGVPAVDEVGLLLAACVSHRYLDETLKLRTSFPASPWHCSSARCGRTVTAHARGRRPPHMPLIGSAVPLSRRRLFTLADRAYVGRRAWRS